MVDQLSTRVIARHEATSRNEGLRYLVLRVVLCRLCSCEVVSSYLLVMTGARACAGVAQVVGQCLCEVASSYLLVMTGEWWNGGLIFAYYFWVMIHKGGFVYIMSSPNRTTLYTGVTSNLNIRIFEHRTKVFPSALLPSTIV